MPTLTQTLSNHRWLLTAALGSLLIILLINSPRAAMAQDGSLFDPGVFNDAETMLDINTVELGIQLKRGLRVFLPAQEAFVDRVLANVNSGRLSRAMVTIVYTWSLRRNPKVPFPYFEIVMRELASRRGVDLGNLVTIPVSQ